MKQLLIVGGLHGDEPSGIAVAKHFLTFPCPGIESIVAHPQAMEANKRFFETDLNRSFSHKISISLEEQLAEDITRQLFPFDFLFDIHNTKGDFTTCAITVIEPTEMHKRLAQHFGFTRLVIMPPSNSLIALYPDKSISFEIALNETNHFSKEYLIEKIMSVDKMKLYDGKLTFYQYVQSIKSETMKRIGITPGEIVNFKRLTISQKKLLHLPEEKAYCPMFAKKQFRREVAFELLEEVI